MGKTLEGFHAQRRTARDELRAFEQRLGVLLQEMNGKEVPSSRRAVDARECRGASASGWRKKGDSPTPTGPLKKMSVGGRPQTRLDSALRAGRCRRRRDVASGLGLSPTPCYAAASNAPQWASK